MRVGRYSSAATLDSDVVDAYYWVKAPGYSDGCSEFLPSDANPFVADGECPRFDDDCAKDDSLGTRPGEPYVPEAGDWFEYQIQMLAGSSSIIEVDVPTGEPTEEPTYLPTYSPTRFPTAKPTAAPTPRPTVFVTPVPTSGPASAQTDVVANAPTSQIADLPTPAPTVKPTKAPSVEPSRRPTARPTVRPTPGPVPRPTTTPTYRPTYHPTAVCIAGWQACATAADSCCEGYLCEANSDGYMQCKPDEDRECRIQYEACTDDVNACCNQLGCYQDNEFHSSCMPSCPDGWLCSQD